MFGFLLIRGDGQPNDSPALVTAGSELDRRREFSTSRRHEWRILAIDTNIDEELVGRGSTSIRFLTSRRAPFALPSRRLPFERHIYRVTAAITLVRPEDDGDFHLVLQDGAGRTMIAETPMASCDNRATLYRQRQMARARAQVRLCARASVTGGRLLRLLPRANRSRPERDRAPPGPRVPLLDKRVARHRRPRQRRGR